MLPRLFTDKAWRFSATLFLFIESGTGLLLTGCGISTKLYDEVDKAIAKGEYTNAIHKIKENKKEYGDKNAVLYNLDLGILYHYDGEVDSSIKYLLQAEREIDELYTKSVTQAALSFVVNDNVLPYEGEDFEKVLVNIFLALNFAAKGESDEALVEARKVDLKLRAYSRQYDGKNRYQEDAFIRYIAGVLYESGGEINDAFISYRKAYETYKTYEKEYGTPAPPFLLDDLARTATLMAFTEETEQYIALGGAPYERSRRRSEGSLLVVVYSGHSPIKEQNRVAVSIPDTAGIIHTFQIALPKFVARSKNPRRYSVSITTSSSTGNHSDSTVVAENVTTIADKTLQDRLALVYLKSGGRAVMKFLASEEAKKKIKKEGGDKALANILGSIAVDVAVGATEQADVRSWRTLPGEIQLARFQLQPGEHIVQVTANDGGYEWTDVPVTVNVGKTTILLVDDIR
jgi:hypothetical protein